ncbi:MAG TPA: hypothetical protein ENK57_24410, partial [Polyangiaceae bacterium]|nr:hypothetical protein [Polyangiaceae bacterium]
MPGEQQEEFVATLAAGGTPANLTDQDAAMLAYARKLTRTPAEIAREDVEKLRGAGFDDRAI